MVWFRVVVVRFQCVFRAGGDDLVNVRVQVGEVAKNVFLVVCTLFLEVKDLVANFTD